MNYRICEVKFHTLMIISPLIILVFLLDYSELSSIPNANLFHFILNALDVSFRKFLHR
jgi:hypothetical protein